MTMWSRYPTIWKPMQCCPMRVSPSNNCIRGNCSGLRIAPTQAHVEHVAVGECSPFPGRSDLPDTSASALVHLRLKSTSFRWELIRLGFSTSWFLFWLFRCDGTLNRGRDVGRLSRGAFVTQTVYSWISRGWGDQYPYIFFHDYCAIQTRVRNLGVCVSSKII